MNLSEILNLISLIITLLGTIFAYNNTPQTQGMFIYTKEERDQKMASNKRNKTLMNIGFALIIFGIILQLIAMFIK